MHESSGLVALLFTDIESSMPLWTADATSMAASLEAHDRALDDEIGAGGGRVFTRAGDSFAAVFPDTDHAARVAGRIQHRLGSLAWPGPRLAVRIGVHVGEVLERDGDYFGPAVNLAARIADTGHGGQVVASADFVDSARRTAETHALGAYQLKGHPDPVELFQLGPGAFPPLRAETGSQAAIRFDGFELDLASRTLRADGDTVKVEPQVFDVLAHLVTHRDRLVTREELLDEVWGDQFVSLSALTTRIKQARHALGDDGRTQRYIRNERGRGYQFLGEVEHPVALPTSPPQSQRRGGRPAAVHERITVFGRSDELRALDQLIGATPVVSVVGPGGVGKTTLVTALAAERRAAGRDSTIVKLDGVRTGDALVPAVTTELGLAGADGDPLTACAEWLSATGQLLVVDNCEHLLDAVVELVAGIHTATPDVAVLTTSRQPLGLRSESVFRLEPLDVPATVAAADASAWPCLELFAAAAQRAGGIHLLDDEDWQLAVELCRQLDGLPLAIELAASRLGTLDIRDLIDGLDDRLDWFRSRAVDGGERQRSLRSTVEWSFRFLDADGTALVAAFALFPAGLRLTDISTLAGGLGMQTAPDELVAQLVDASVLQVERRDREARYTMLETIRQYGLEHLGADPILRAAAERHLMDHALAVAAAERDAWTGDRDPRGRSLARLHDEVPNLRAARNLMLERGAHADAIGVATGLCAFTEEACLAELWSWHETGGLDIGDDVETRAAARLLEATAARNRGEIEVGESAALEAASLSDDPWIRGRGIHTAAMAALFRGEPALAAERWLDSDRELGGCRGRMFAAMASAFAGDLDAAAQYLAECTVEPDSRVPIDLFTNVHLVRGEVARVAGTGDARNEFEQAVAVAREHGLLFSLGIAQVPLVTILEADGDVGGAAVGYRELIELFLRSGTWTQVWTTLRNAARLLAAPAPETALLIWLRAARDPGSPALDDAARTEIEDLVSAASARVGTAEAERISRRAAIATRADVARAAVDALGLLVPASA